MKLFSSEHIFNHPWEMVTAANWKKYPNEMTPHVINVDYLDRWVDPKTGFLHTERLLTCSQNAPAFISKLLGGENVSHVYEKSQVDPSGKKITLISKNLTFSNLMTVEETCTYTPVQSNINCTLFTQNVEITSLVGFYKFKDYIEEFCIGRFQTNATRGRIALEEAIEKIYTDTKEKLTELFDVKKERKFNGEFLDDFKKSSDHNHSSSPSSSSHPSSSNGNNNAFIS